MLWLGVYSWSYAGSLPYSKVLKALSFFSHKGCLLLMRSICSWALAYICSSILSSQKKIMLFMMHLVQSALPTETNNTDISLAYDNNHFFLFEDCWSGTTLLSSAMVFSSMCSHGRQQRLRKGQNYVGPCQTSSQWWYISHLLICHWPQPVP